MRIPQLSEFENMRGGMTREWKTDEPVPHTLAYLDSAGSGMSDVTVFDPTNGHSRQYLKRTTQRAQEIVERHLLKMGYTLF